MKRKNKKYSDIQTSRDLPSVSEAAVAYDADDDALPGGRFTLRVGQRGTVVLPVTLRRQLGLAEGSTLLAELRDEGILLRPAVTLPRHGGTPERPLRTFSFAGIGESGREDISEKAEELLGKGFGR